MLLLLNMNASEILKHNGLKKSAQRIAVINILQKHIIPLSEDEIKEEMGEIYDRVTFYRTIQALCNAKIIHRIIVDKTCVEYALNTEEDAHHSHIHFYCTVCHSVTCLKNTPIKQYDLPDGYQQKECQVLIKGICPSCNSSQ